MPSWIGDVIYLIPLAALIWKAALQAGEIKQLRKDVDTNHVKINAIRDEQIGSVKDILQKIDIRLTRIETTLENGGYNGKGKVQRRSNVSN